MSWTARDYALVVLTEVERNMVFASAALDTLLLRTGGIEQSDRALITELVYGVLRHRRRLDRALAPLLLKPLGEAHPTVARTLRMAAYQILMLDRVPARAAVDHAVTAVRRSLGKSPAGFVNAVLRRLAQEREPSLPDRENDPGSYVREALSFPDAIASMMEQRLSSAEAVALGEALNVRPSLVFAANTLKIGRDELASKIERLASGVTAKPTSMSPEGLLVDGMTDPVRHPLHQEGLFVIQGEASQLVCHMVAPRPGQKVLDACCGRGGKTIHMACLSGDAASILAVDQNPQRLSEAAQRAETAGIKGVVFERHDLTRSLPSSFVSAFDRVLLDAPCTGLGALQRHPEAKWRFEIEAVDRMARLQQSLLSNVAQAVAPGGTLTYAVCTFSAEEGPRQIEDFLDRHQDFDRADSFDEDNPVRPLLTKASELLLWPHIHRTEGFFVAILRRRR